MDFTAGATALGNIGRNTYCVGTGVPAIPCVRKLPGRSDDSRRGPRPATTAGPIGPEGDNPEPVGERFLSGWPCLVDRGAVQADLHVLRLLSAISALVLLVGCGTGADRSPGSSISVQGTDVFLSERSGSADLEGPTVLFLHGASFTAEVWIETGILDTVSEAGLRSVAIDLPGYGMTPAIDSDRGDFLAAVMAELDDGNGVVVVSPSMSGSWSLDLIASHGAGSMRGFVPVAPVGIETFSELPLVEGLPTLIVWGADDDVISPSLAEDLATVLVDSQVEIVDEAGHAVYRNQPDAFSDLLLGFVESL